MKRCDPNERHTAHQHMPLQGPCIYCLFFSSHRSTKISDCVSTNMSDFACVCVCIVVPSEFRHDAITQGRVMSFTHINNTCYLYKTFFCVFILVYLESFAIKTLTKKDGSPKFQFSFLFFYKDMP